MTGLSGRDGSQMRLRELVKMNRSLGQGGHVWSEAVDGLSAAPGTAGGPQHSGPVRSVLGAAIA